MTGDDPLKTWEVFRKERQLAASNFAFKDGIFSLICDVVGEQIHEIYRACGFTESQFDELHSLLTKIEQLCLFTLFSAFERFKLHPLSLKAEKVDMSSGAEEHLCALAEQKGGIRKGKRKYLTRKKAGEEKVTTVSEGNNHVAEIEKSGIEPDSEAEDVKPDCSIGDVEPNSNTEDAEMGRGKRKKFMKLQFDMLDEVHARIGSSSEISGERASNSIRSASNVKKDKSSKNINKAKDLQEPPLKKLKSRVIHKNVQKIDKDKSIQGIPNSGEVQSAVNENIDTLETDSDCQGLNLGLGERNQNKVDYLSETCSSPKHDGEDSRKEDPAVPSQDSFTAVTSVSLNNKHKKTQLAGERTDFDCDNEAPIICSICKTRLPGSRDLFKHWKQVHRKEHEEANKQGAPPNLFYCEVCHESFDSPRRFKLHYRIHSGARPHPCQLCDKRFRIFKGLMDHMMCHSKEKPYACPQCPKRFINKKLLNHHIKIHNNEIVPRVCEMCGKQYRTSLGLKLHYRVHAGIRPHKCDVCGMAFTQRCSLQIHKRLHTGDKRHICDVCGWRFNTNNALVTHKRVHTGERPYKCSQCPFQAASSSCLKDHEIVHSKAKPFFCRAPGCNKLFKRQAHLMTHLKKKHTGLKPYSCALCGAKFAMVSELTHHEKSDACDGGRLKKEPSPEPEPFSNPAGPLMSIVASDQSNQPLLMLEGQSILAEDDGPRIRGRRKPKLQQQAPAQELQVSHQAGLPGEADQIVIHIVTEPGMDGTDIVLSEEEMAAIVRLSQQM